MHRCYDLYIYIGRATNYFKHCITRTVGLIFGLNNVFGTGVNHFSLPVVILNSDYGRSLVLSKEIEII